jgi:hypothetical protein
MPVVVQVPPPLPVIVQTPVAPPAVAQAPIAKAPLAQAAKAPAPVVKTLEEARAPDPDFATVQARAPAPVNAGPVMEVDSSRHRRELPPPLKVERIEKAEEPRIQDLPVRRDAPRYPVREAAPRHPVQQAAPKLPVHEVAPRVVVQEAAPRRPVQQVAPKAPVQEAAPRVVVQEAAPRYVVQQVTPPAAEETRAPARLVNQVPEIRRPRAPAYVVNQGSVQFADAERLGPAYAGPQVVAVPMEGVVAVYPTLPPDPAWKRCEDYGRAYRCGRYSYHPYGEPGYRPYGSYQVQASIPVYAVAPNARIIQLDPGD